MNNSRPVGPLKPYALDEDGEYERGFNRSLAIAEEIMQRKPGDPILNPEWVKLENKPHLVLNFPCNNCGGTGSVDSGGFTPWGQPIDLPCPSCQGKWDELALIGASWKLDSSLEKWFPLTAEELKKLKELNEDKFKTIQAYCKMASLDKWKIKTLIEAIDVYLNTDGYGPHADILTHARADVVNATNPDTIITPSSPHP